MRKILLLLLLVNFSIAVFAQTGPAGLGNSSNNVLWLSSDQGTSTTTDGSPTSFWNDISGNANNSLQGVLANQPLYIVSGINGLPSIRFDGANDYLTVVDADNLDNTNGVSVFIVAQPNLPDALPRGLVSKRTAAGSQESYYLFTYTAQNLYFNAATYRINGNDAVTNQPQVFSAIYNGSDADPRSRIYYNGNESGNGNGPTSIGNMTSDLHIGILNPGYAQGFSGDISEVIVYRTALNNAERLILETYLSNRYNINLTASGYSSTTHTQNFVGIGYANGDKYSNTANVGSGILLSEINNTLNETNEFVFTGHDGTAHGIDNSDLPVIPGVSLDDRWQRIYYIERVQDGTIDNGTTDIRIGFDFTGTGITLATDRVYYLLYRSGTSGTFSEIPGGTASASDGKVWINISNANFQSGYYVLAKSDQVIKTWYSLNDGDWDDFNTWSLKPNEPDNPSNEIPGALDMAVIQDNKTVSVVLNNTACGVLNVVDGTVDFGTTTGNTFSTITGQTNGKIKLAADNFPSGDASGFADEATGGTIEYYGTGYNLSNPHNFRNMLINLANNADQLILLSDYTLNGNLTITKGELHFGNAVNTVSRNLTIYENIEIQVNGKIRTGSANSRHELNLYGNFTNYGDVQFTNRAAVNYTAEATDGIVDANFLSATRNQNMILEGPTRFYRIAIEKGISNTYELYMEATDAAYFSLFGYANQGHPDDEQLATNTNAFGLSYGTVRVGSNITIARLNGGGNYNVSTNAVLWVDGGTVAKPAGTGEAVVVYGKVKVSSGTFNSYAPSGITTRLNGTFESTGGTTNLNQFRTSVYGSQHQGGYVQSGGTVNLVAGALSADYYRFCLTYTGNVFSMTGGTLHIQQTGGRGAIFINSDEVNQNVTGGTVICDISNANDFIITSKAPFWDLEFRKTVSNTNIFKLDEGVDVGGTDEYLAAQPLKVLRNFRIRGEQTSSGYPNIDFYPVTSPTNVNDVYIGGSFIIEAGAQYWTAADGNRAANYNSAATLPTIYNSTYFNQTDGTSAVDSLYWGNVGDVFDYDGNGTPDADENMAEFGSFVLNRNHGNELRISSSSAQLDAAITLDVNGDLVVESGTLCQGRLTVRTWASVTNYDRLGSYYTAGPYPTATGTPSQAQVRFRESEDGAPVINSSDGAIFGNTRFNVNPSSPFVFERDMYFERLQFMRGILYLGKYNMKVDDMWDLNNDDNTNTGFFIQGSGISSYLAVANSGRIDNGGGAVNDQEIMIITDGNASDGGLTLKVSANSLNDNGNRIRNNTSVLTFPIAFSTDNFATGLTNTYYRPAQVKVTNFSDDGYLTIRPVSEPLHTSNPAGGKILQHYWRVTHSYFTTLPTVAYRYYYRNQSIVGVVDLPSAATDEANYVPGKVLDEGIYQRSYESNAVAQQDLNGVFNGPLDANTRVMVFNGNNLVATDDSLFGFSANAPGFVAENANYSCGVYNRFEGTPTIYYNKRDGNFNWNANTSWYTTSGGTTNPPAGVYPKAGDIAVIRGNNFGDAIIVNGTQAAAEIILQREGTYTDIEDVPRLWLEPTDVLNVSKISGIGELYLRQSLANSPTVNADIGDFAANDISVVIFYMTQNGTYNVTEADLFTEFPILRIYGQLAGYNRTASFNYDFNAKQLLVDGESNFLVGGNYTIDNRTRLGFTGGGRIIFPNGTESYRLKTGDFVTGRAKNSGNNNFQLTVQTGGGNGIDHFFEVERNIDLNFPDAFDEGTCIIDLFSTLTDNNVILRLSGEGNNAFNDNYSAGNSTVGLYKIEVDKGIGTSSSFTFNDSFTLNGPTSGVGVQKALTLENGKLYLDNAAININLSTGDDSFVIPSSAGLVVSEGEVNVTGANSGILLDGLLRVETGGVIDMDGGVGVNNFIEYSASGNAAIEVAGGTLTVGSQIRRGTLSTEGVLKYSQTGGNVIVGKNAAPQANRGVFEIINTGSQFTYTSGTLTVVRPQTAATEATVLLEPSVYSVDNTTLQLGNNDTPAGSVLTLKSKIELGNVTVSGVNGPIARLKDRSLTIKRDLTIDAGCSFDGTGVFNLTVNRHIINNGAANLNVDTLFLSGTSTSPSAAMQEITGNVTVNHLVVEPETSVTMQAGSDLEVDGDLYLNSGQLIDGENTILVKGNVTNNASHASSNPALGGIKFGGTTLQRIYGTGQFGRIEIDNTNGVQLETNLSLNNNLTLTNGILQLQSNKLTLGLNAYVEGSGFDDNKMIAVGGGDFLKGIQKTIPTVIASIPADPYSEIDPAYSYSFTFPIGVDNGTVKKYTPVDFHIASNATQGNIDLYPVNRKHITLDASQTDVLQYYWIMNSSGLSSFTSLIHTHYKNTDVVGDESAYIGAKLYDNFWAKYEESVGPPAIEVVYEADDYTAFITSGENRITGEYTAGIEPHIPDEVPLYYTKQDGDWTDANTWEREDGGPVPAGGPVGQRVHIRTAHTVTVSTNYRRSYRTTINGRLVLGTTKNHILGYVDGTGTLSVDISSLPSGDYTDFFACGTGGTMEWAGGTYGLPSSITQYNNITVTGTGTKTFPNYDMTICGDLRIEQDVTLKMVGTGAGYRYTDINGSVFLKDNAKWDHANRVWVKLQGDLEKDNTASLGTNFTAQTIELNGNNTQIISGSYSGLNAFNNLEVDNPSIIQMTGPSDVRVYLAMERGRILTSNSSLLNVTEASGNGFYTYTNGLVEGPIRINLNSSSPNKFLPVGQNSIKKFIYPLDLPALVGLWTGEYFNSSPTSHVPSMSHLNMVAPLQTISQSEYWRITGPNAVASRIRLTLNGTSDIAAGVSNLNNLRIVYWNGTNWAIAGTGATITGTAASGTISTTGTFTFDGTEQYFTIGAVETVVLPTAQITSNDSEICDGGAYPLVIALTGNGPWEIDYNDGTTSYTNIPVASSPHTINILGMTTGVYTYTIEDVRDNGSVSGFVYGSSPIVTVYANPNPFNVTSGGDICGASETTIEIDGSEIGFTYQLYRNAVYFGLELAGTGSALSFTGVDQSGTYTVRAYNNAHSSCFDWMTVTPDPLVVSYVSLAIAEISSLLSNASICENNVVEFEITLTGVPPFTFTVEDNFGGSWPVVLNIGDLTNVGPNTYTYNYTVSDNPVWNDLDPLPKVYTYTITSVIDSAGCGSGTIVGSGVDVDVYKIPETGSQYHISNDWP